MKKRQTTKKRKVAKKTRVKKRASNRVTLLNLMEGIRHLNGMIKALDKK